MMPKVSVIIPTHNRPDFIVRALDSVYRQTFQDFEVLVVDDGDKPRTHSVLGHFLNKANFRYLETKKNTGGSATRNLGIKESTGQYIAFLDDDDEWLPSKLEKFVKTYNDNPSVAVVYSGVRAHNSTDKVILYESLPKASQIRQVLPSLLYKCDIWTSALSFKSECFKNGFLFDETLTKNQEWDLELRLAQKYQFFSIAEVLTIINIGGGEQMGSRSNLANIINGTEKFLAKHSNLYNNEPKALALRLFNLGLLYWDAKLYQKARATWLKSWGYHWHNLIPVKHWFVSMFGCRLYNLLTRR